MAKFRYTAVNAAGKVVKVVMEAADRATFTIKVQLLPTSAE